MQRGFLCGRSAKLRVGPLLAPWHRLMKPALRAWPKRTNLCREPTKPREGSAATKKRSAQVLQSGIGRILPSNRSANLPRPLMAGAFSRQWQRRALSAVSNETWLNVEVTLNSSNRVVCRIASAGMAVHGSTTTQRELDWHKKTIGMYEGLVRKLRAEHGG